jgi:hypothetical protein
MAVNIRDMYINVETPKLGVSTEILSKCVERKILIISLQAQYQSHKMNLV